MKKLRRYTLYFNIWFFYLSLRWIVLARYGIKVWWL